jgi:hypothetical protein
VKGKEETDLWFKEILLMSKLFKEMNSCSVNLKRKSVGVYKQRSVLAA